MNPSQHDSPRGCSLPIPFAGRTALAVILSAALAEINLAEADSARLVPDLVEIAARVSAQRKGVLKERDHLRMSFQVN